MEQMCEGAFMRWTLEDREMVGKRFRDITVLMSFGCAMTTSVCAIWKGFREVVDHGNHYVERIYSFCNKD